MVTLLTMGSKSPLLAAVLSLFLPGVGHFYCGAWPRGALAILLAVAAFALRGVLGGAGSVVVFAVDAWAAWDAWKIAKTLSALEAAEDAGPFERTWLHWVWILMRAGWISAFLLFFGWMGLNGVRYSLLEGHWLVAALVFAPTILLFYLSWLVARSTWRVMMGIEPMMRSAVRNEIGATIFICGLFGLMLAIVWPSFSELTRKSAEGAMKGHLITLRNAASRGEKPPVLPALPALWTTGRQPHERNNGSIELPAGQSTDSGRWAFVVGSSTTVFIDCTHTDSRGLSWTNY